MKIEKTKTLYAVITILLIIIFSLIGSIIYGKQIIAAQQNGYNLGLQTSIITIIQQSRNCQPVALSVGNQSFQFIDVSCLQPNQPSQPAIGAQ